MSGARRAASSTAGSNLRCVACANPFSRIEERFPRVVANTSTESACIEIFMRESPCLLPARLARGGVSLSAYARQGGAPPSSDETIRLPERLIEAVMNLIWTPAQLAMLAKVVDLNGFSAAARALAVPKAAVSRAVADLEKTLGVRVLERTTRRIALTSAGRLLYPHADGTTRQRLLGAPPALLCATPAYLQRRGQPERPDDLRGHDLLTPDAALLPEFRLVLERGTQRAEVPLRPKLAVDDPAVLHAATAAGLGVGLLPEFLCRQGLATGRLKAVLSEWTVPPAAALYALYPAALESDPRVQQFVDFLAANIVPALALPVPVRPPPIHPSTQDFAPH